MIGVWGYDIRDNSLIEPDTHTDVMTYCVAYDWISDYHFTRAANYRIGTGAGPVAARERVLLVRGARRDGVLELDPAFVMDAPPALPETPGPYRLAGVDARGGELFSHRFDMALIADLPDEDVAAFALAVPASEAWATALDRLVLTGPEGRAELGRGGAPPERWIMDAAGERVRAILRGESALADALSPDLRDILAGETRTLTSRGIPDPSEWRR